MRDNRPATVGGLFRLSVVMVTTHFALGGLQLVETSRRGVSTQNRAAQPDALDTGPANTVLT